MEEKIRLWVVLCKHLPDSDGNGEPLWVRIKRLRAIQNFTGNTQDLFRCGRYGPTYQANAALVNLKTGDTLRMDTTSVIKIRTGAGRCENRPVRVSGDNDSVLSGSVGTELLFNFFY